MTRQRAVTARSGIGRLRTSLGGIGGAAGHYGLQVDNVRALEVVTGAGELVRCTRSSNAETWI